MHASRCLVRFGRALLVILPFGLTFAQTSYVNFEGKQTRPISLSPDGTRLFAVNTPDARLSVFDVTHPLNPFLIAEIPVGVEPVSVTPRDNDEVWVVNEVSDSVSIVSVSRRIVTDTIYVKDEPADVVFAAGKAFISAARNNRIAVFDVNTHAAITNIPVFGENPRALTVNSNGTRIYAAFALSGNRTDCRRSAHRN
jgi:YVTN family beta-propeller protein